MMPAFQNFSGLFPALVSPALSLSLFLFTCFGSDIGIKVPDFNVIYSAFPFCASPAPEKIYPQNSNISKTLPPS